MNATIKTLPDSKKINTCICQRPGLEIWAHIPDDHGDKYPYPLQAKYCPECGRRISQ